MNQRHSLRAVRSDVVIKSNTKNEKLTGLRVAAVYRRGASLASWQGLAAYQCSPIPHATVNTGDLGLPGALGGSLDIGDHNEVTFYILGALSHKNAASLAP